MVFDEKTGEDAPADNDRPWPIIIGRGHCSTFVNIYVGFS